MKSTTLHEYRQQYPQTVKFPTITQNGLLALILERQRVKAVQAAARRERMHRFIDAITHPLHTLHLDFGGKLAAPRTA
jgi:hypothetical protein